MFASPINLANARILKSAFPNIFTFLLIDRWATWRSSVHYSPKNKYLWTVYHFVSNSNHQRYLFLIFFDSNYQHLLKEHSISVPISVFISLLIYLVSVMLPLVILIIYVYIFFISLSRSSDCCLLCLELFWLTLSLFWPFDPLDGHMWVMCSIT